MADVDGPEEAARARHARLTELVGQARHLKPPARDAYLAGACTDDPSLVDEVRSYLAELAEGSSLDMPGVRALAERVAADLLLTSSYWPAPVPARIAQYRIDRELGRGGMGVVYLGWDEALERPVAIKTLRVEIASDASLMQRLRREARLLALMSHPYIAAILDVEEAGGRLYLVLEYLDGESLAARLGRGPMAVEEALRTGRRIAEALASAHRRGVIHRDLKPGNVQITTDGIVKVLDFGLAVRHLPADDDPTRLSREGSLHGTPSYMSPEQATGGTVGPASDVWSFGCVLYECLTGVRLWRRADVSATLRAVVAEEPELRALPESVPAEVVELLRSCLAKEPKERPLDLGEVAEVLRDAGSPSSGSRLSRGALRARGKGNLVPERDAFVGRERELGELLALLDGGARLVTVVGTGGVGKTRFTHHLGLTAHERWPGGVWFCDLTEARSADGVAAAVATALDVPLTGTDAVTQLGHAIAGRGRCLILLDNFEQVAEHASATADRWVERAEQAQFLVTSRVRLDLRGEQTYALEPLDVEREGVELFTVRARAARPRFAVTDDNRADVVAVVRQLDSLPLAIELAAARMRVLTVVQLRERLADRFHVLTGGKARSDRHSSLRATLDWSWQLLEPWSRRPSPSAPCSRGASPWRPPRPSSISRAGLTHCWSWMSSSPSSTRACSGPRSRRGCPASASPCW